MLTETFLRYGQSEPPVKLIALRAGPLTMLYDPTSGLVRRIKFGEIEVLRGIYAAVRDHNWATVPGKLREIIITIEPQSFHLKFASEHRQGNIHFTWHGTVHGEADGILRYEFDGKAESTFLRNRIGFCVLHPIRECAGAKARQFRLDGTERECRFPELIEPQIFGQCSLQELRSVQHEIAPDVWAKLEFKGDVFEMEDQRNWTDASFKTYCTPLALPFPVEVKKGCRISQSVTLKLIGNSTKRPLPLIEVTSPSAEVIRLTIPNVPTARLPSIGLGTASHGEPLSEAEIDALHQLRLAHLRVDVSWKARDSAATFARAVREATQLKAGLELAVHLPRDVEPNPGEFLRVLNQQTPVVTRILALREDEAATSPATFAWVRKHFKQLGAPIGAGSDCNFGELNREYALGRLALRDSDFLFWSLNPQVHAFDHFSIMETLEAQTATAVSAHAFAAGRPLVVSPVTMKQRFNPVATKTGDCTPQEELPPQVDARQLSHFAAAWTLGSIAALAKAGVESATYFETTGWRGVMERATGSALPEKFPSVPGAPFPMFQILAHLAGFSEMSVEFSPSQELLAIGLFQARRFIRVIIANLTDAHQTAVITFLNRPETSLQIQPYQTIRIEA